MEQRKDPDRMRGAAAVMTLLVFLPWLIMAATAALIWQLIS